MGPEDDPQVSWSSCPGLRPVMEGWSRLQCHHPQEQVSLVPSLPASSYDGKSSRHNVVLTRDNCQVDLNINNIITR